MNPKPHLPGTPRAKPAARDWVGLLLSIWESEGVLSIRLILASLITAFALSMRGLGRMTTPETLSYLAVVVELLGLGTLKIIASRFSPKPTIDSTQQPKPNESTT